MTQHSEMLGLLNQVYDSETAVFLHDQLQLLIDKYRPLINAAGKKQLSHEDAILITYGDMVQEDAVPHLQTLHSFLAEQVQDTISTVHILPFYPWSSDDGFSVIDYLAIDPPLGEWADLQAMSGSFRLMFDAVINHISQQSEWFQRFLRGERPYTDYFKAVDPSLDLSDVFRPRTLPLLTPFETIEGTKHVWTTFSPDQIDLNYESPDLYLEVIEMLLAYVNYGADLIRLDAIGFMWKVPGTRSLHLPETHRLIQVMRLVLNEVAPHVALVTETNVPHKENISYFGNGCNEAQMVYNFSLPPLLMHAFHTGNADYLSQWAASLEYPSKTTTFFNFCASHDGVGVTPARGILPTEEIDGMAQRVEALGGRVSYKSNSDGSQSPYELNINYLNGLGDPDQLEDDVLKAERFLTSQAIMLALQGVPGIYFHSLFGSQNWQEGVSQTGHNRTINREKLQRSVLERELAESGLRRLVFAGYQTMLAVRRQFAAFDPYGEQRIHMIHRSVMVIERLGDESVLCLHNVSAESVTFALPAGWPVTSVQPILGDMILNKQDTQVTLPAYGRLWLTK